MKQILKELPLFVFVCFFALLIFTTKNKLDPDFGWHIKVGELVSQGQLPRVDTFSYSMPTYPVIYHEWLTDFFLFNIYTQIGFFALVILFSILALTSLYLIYSRFEKPIQIKKTASIYTYINVFLITFGFLMLLPFSGVRPQIITWVFYAFLCSFIFDPNIKGILKNTILVLTFIIWVNLHGGFAIGIATLILFTIFKNIKKFNISDWTTLLLSTLATFVNPYGPMIWKEVFVTISDSSLRWTISEWLPMVFRFDPFFLFLLVASTIFMWRYKNKFLFYEIVIYVFLTLQTLTGQRNLPLWVIFSLPLIQRSLFCFVSEISRSKLSFDRFKRFSFLLVLLFILASFIQIRFSFFTASNFEEEIFYPAKAVDYLKADLPQGEVLSQYDWGGYLIWKLPEKKVYIDGRMPSWETKYENAGQTKDAMEEFGKVVSKEISFQSFVEKYHVDTILWSVRNINIVKLHIEELGWQEVYKDETAIIWKKSI